MGNYYSGFSIIQTVIIRIQTLKCTLTAPRFQQQREKDAAVVGVLLQEKEKLLYEQLFHMLQHLLHPVRDLDHDLQCPSDLAERSCKRCSTL